MEQLALWVVVIVVVGVGAFLYARAGVKRTPAEPVIEPARYVDEKRAKAIKQAALFADSGGKKGAPQCPRCGAEMTLELSKRGKQAGDHFWGCTEYPACGGTRKA